MARLEMFICEELDSNGTHDVEVHPFNGDMAVCSSINGPAIITKEQAKEFFGLVEIEGE